MAFLTVEQKSLAGEIASLLTSRGETVAVAEATTGGLTSAALLWVAGASRYYAGGGVTYTLNSRTALAGADPAQYVNYQGTTPEMIAHLAESMRQRLGATWCIAESGLAGPTPGRSGAPPGKTTIGVAGPVSRTQVFETGIADREANMVEFLTLSLRFLRDAIKDAAG
ncbi:MAG TPA: CinA family protein [Dehalococcoidia bacterium]|jgi:PncC family amidohydrolase